MKTLTVTALMIVLLGFAAVAGAAPKDEPGYIDLSWIEIPDHADEIQDIDLGHVLESVAKDAERNGDSELAKALGMVRSVRMKSFSVDDESAEMVKKALSGEFGAYDCPAGMVEAQDETIWFTDVEGVAEFDAEGIEDVEDEE